MGLIKNILGNIIKSSMNYKEIEFHVAGVTFKNGRKTRQALLRAMKFKDKPFDQKIEITFERYEYEGSPAIKVLANGEQIGNVPHNLVAEFLSYWKSDYLIEKYQIVGGGSSNYGCIIKVLFNSK